MQHFVNTAGLQCFTFWLFTKTLGNETSLDRVCLVPCLLLDGVCLGPCLLLNGVCLGPCLLSDGVCLGPCFRAKNLGVAQLPVAI